LQGQEVKFTVKVTNVRGVNLVELNDEFVQKNGMGQTAEDLRQQIRENLAEQSRNDYDDDYFEQVLEQIKAGATIKYPPQVLEHEVTHVFEDFERRIKSQGVENLETYYKTVNTTKEAFEEEQVRPTAKKRLERSLIMEQVARAEKIEIDQAALEQEFRNTWATLAMSDEEFSKRTKGGTKPTRELVEAVSATSANRLMTRRTLAALKSIATGGAAVGESAEAPEEKPVDEQGQKTEEEPVAQELPAVTEPVVVEVTQEVPAKKTRKKKTA
jgi:trigger factor